MQSGYSELMGLYPPGQADKLTQSQQSIVKSGVSLPPFGVRDADTINDSLAANALPNGF